MKKSKKNVLIIGDTQFPYVREDYLDFCKAVEKKYGCGRVVHIGDIADCLNFSFYEKDPSSPSTLDEIEALEETFTEWSAEFPNMECVVGNHDNRIRRKLNAAGFPQEVLSVEQIFRDIFGFPQSWTMHDKIIIDTRFGPVYCLHGDERGSSVVAGSTARKLGASLIRGHHHSRAFVYHISTPHQLMFDMIVGCGIDKDSVAFRYNKKDLDRPIYACGVLVDGVPHLVTMNLDEEGNWDGEV